ncbi:MAG: SGNH/GDSL hydrolase family protein [Fimbriimonadaceae bacterium]|nr:SGNH/GDSL hydrolase family protein [Alphaproteobacteria bacterium]
MRYKQTPLRFSLLLTFGFGLSVVCMELMLRVIEATPLWRVLPIVQAQFGRPDPETGYSLRPGFSGWWVKENRTWVDINEHGMRDRARTLTKGADVKRVALMGDSLTEAVQVSENNTFAAISEAALTSRENPVEVLNFGLSGANPLLQLLRFRSVAKRLSPDVAVFVLNLLDFADQSFADDSTFPAYVDSQQGDGLTIGRSYRERRSQRLLDGWIGGAFFFIVDHSRIANVLYTRQKIGLDGGVPAGVAGRTEDDHCGKLVPYLDSTITLWRDGRPERIRRRLDRFLADLSSELRSAGIPGVIIWRGLDPTGQDCQDELQRRQVVADVVEQFLTQYSIVAVDLDSEIAMRLPQANDVEKLRGFGAKVGQGHLNEYGHRVYAQVLIDALRPILSGVGVAPTRTSAQP